MSLCYFFISVIILSAWDWQASMPLLLTHIVPTRFFICFWEGPSFYCNFAVFKVPFRHRKLQVICTLPPCSIIELLLFIRHMLSKFCKFFSPTSQSLYSSIKLSLLSLHAKGLQNFTIPVHVLK